MSSTDRRSFLRGSIGAAAAVALDPSWLPTPPRSDDPLSVALVGAGRQGRAILGELAKLESVRVDALCDVIDSRLRSGLRRAKGAEGFDDYRKLLDAKPDVQAVLVATPTHLHRGIATDALAAGKHVYCEAPLASTDEDLTAIVTAARAAKTRFQTGLQGRSNPIYKLARSFFRSGAIEEQILLRAQNHKKASWRRPTSNPADAAALNWHLDAELSLGLAGELGTHQFDVVHWFLGAYPTSVQGWSSLRLHDDGREVPDTVQCMLSFPEGRRLAWDATLANSFEGTYELFCGSMGAIKLAWTAGWMFKEADAPTLGWEVYANRQQFHNEQGITLIADATQLAAQNKLKEGVGLPNPPLYYALEDFVRSVTEDAPIACSADEGRRATLVGIAAHRASIAGDAVAIDASFGD